MNFLNRFDLKGGIIMGIWTALMWVLVVFSFVLQRSIDGNIVALYSVAVGTYGISKAATKIGSMKYEGDV